MPFMCLRYLNPISCIEIITDLNTQRTIASRFCYRFCSEFMLQFGFALLDIDVILIFHAFDCEEMRLTWLPERTVLVPTRPNLPI